ncbi:HNH endonuclease [Haloferax sulfurifontis]|uniref:HNH endonuclease n=1 Tax=Haloferax sulfurifontis TaxID=255616 RepID=UPI0019552530|nr:HNH endonuclease [Haloferax sulfurifontis]
MATASTKSMIERPFPKVKDRPTSDVPAIARDGESGMYEVIECPECGSEAFAYLQLRYACRECKVGSRILQKEVNYGGRWERVREWILERDNDQCQRCGDSSVGLQVHHKEKLVWFESIQEANTPENLISLCEDCHGEVEEQPEMACLPVM